MKSQYLFKNYFTDQLAQWVKIDAKKRIVQLYDFKSQMISTVYFSTKLQFAFTVTSLLETKGKKGDTLFYVLPNGYDGKDWLYTSEIGDIL